MERIKEYIANLGWGWLLFALNLFTAWQMYSGITGIPMRIEGIPIGVWLGLLLIGLLLMPFFTFSKVSKDLSDIKHSLPNIEYSQSYETPLYNKKTKELYFHVIELWFKNCPSSPMESSIAKGVTASISFYDYSDKPKLILNMQGVWFIAEAPDFGAPQDIRSTMDMSPNDEKWKLLVALKHDGEDDAYGFAYESFTYNAKGDGREELKKLVPGEYLVDIELKGVGVKNKFWSKLTNPGKGAELNMDTVKVNDDKLKNKGITKKALLKLLNKASKPIKKPDRGNS
jgi:hypothetical protein